MEEQTKPIDTPSPEPPPTQVPNLVLILASEYRRLLAEEMKNSKKGKNKKLTKKDWVFIDEKVQIVRWYPEKFIEEVMKNGYQTLAPTHSHIEKRDESLGADPEKVAESVLGKEEDQ